MDAWSLEHTPSEERDTSQVGKRRGDDQGVHTWQMSQRHGISAVRQDTAVREDTPAASVAPMGLRCASTPRPWRIDSTSPPGERGSGRGPLRGGGPDGRQRQHRRLQGALSTDRPPIGTSHLRGLGRQDPSPPRPDLLDLARDPALRSIQRQRPACGNCRSCGKPQTAVVSHEDLGRRQTDPASTVTTGSSVRVLKKRNDNESGQFTCQNRPDRSLVSNSAAAHAGDA